MRNLELGERLAALAGACAAVAAALGFIPGLYRDPAALIAQSHGQDLATLVIGLPTLAIGVWLTARHSLRGRLVALGALGYLAYTYATYAFAAVLNPATPLYIAVVGLAVWSFCYTVPRLPRDGLDLGLASGVPRRAAGWFLVLTAVTFGLLWLGQIGQAAFTGTRPQALIDAGWPNNPVYVLDLAFVPPLCFVTGISLLGARLAWPGVRLVLPLLVFIPLLAVGIVILTLFAAADGQPIEMIQSVIFVVLTVVSATLAWFGLRSPQGNRVFMQRSATGSAR